MKRINTSHQSISAAQRNCNYRPSGAIASHVLDSTIAYESDKPVILVRSHESRLVGSAVLLAGKQCYLVASKFAGHMYVVTSYKGIWQCSSKDESTSRLMIAKAQAYRAELVARKVAA